MVKNTTILLFSIFLIHLGCKGSITTESINEVDYNNFKLVITTWNNEKTELYTVLSNGSNLTKIAELPDLYMSPKWSSDGSQIILMKDSNPNNEIYTIDPAGVNLQKLCDGTEFVASPTENKICYITHIDTSWSNVFVIWEIFAINTDGSNETKLTDTKLQKFGLLWSPMDSVVAYTLNDNIDGSGETLYKLNIQNGTNDILVGGHDIPIITDWSPNEKYVLFHEHYRDIFMFDLSTNVLLQLTNERGTNERAKFSPDGKKIVFQSSRNQYTHIYTMNVDGSEQVRISNSSNYDCCPEWSPDGTLISYMSYSNDIPSSQIMIMSRIGSGNKVLADTEGLGTGFDWYPIQ